MRNFILKENGGTLTVWIYEDDLGVEKGKNIIHPRLSTLIFQISHDALHNHCLNLFNFRKNISVLNKKSNWG